VGVGAGEAALADEPQAEQQDRRRPGRDDQQPQNAHARAPLACVLGLHRAALMNGVDRARMRILMSHYESLRWVFRTGRENAGPPWPFRFAAGEKNSPPSGNRRSKAPLSVCGGGDAPPT